MFTFFTYFFGIEWFSTAFKVNWFSKRNITSKFKFSTKFFKQRVIADCRVDFDRHENGTVSNQNQIHGEKTSKNWNEGHPDNKQIIAEVRDEKVCCFLQKFEMKKRFKIKIITKPTKIVKNIFSHLCDPKKKQNC